MRVLPVDAWILGVIVALADRGVAVNLAAAGVDVVLSQERELGSPAGAIADRVRREFPDLVQRLCPCPNCVPAPLRRAMDC